MGRRFTIEATSPYYPPRARWYSWVFTMGEGLRRRLALDRLRLPGEVTFFGLVSGFLVPGLAVYLRGPRLWGHCALASYGALLGIYVIWMGHTAANLAFGILISMHCSGFIYYCAPLLAGANFQGRITTTLLVLLGMGVLIYWPARQLAQRHIATPLIMSGHVVIVRPDSPQNVRRGTYVWYTMPASVREEVQNGGYIQFHGGAGFAPVLAVGGDQVEFKPDCFTVNGVSRAKLEYMPDDGRWIVPEKHWFIWPNLAISGGHGNVPASAIGGIMMRMADVTADQYLGQPFEHWFWHKQVLPAL